MDQAEKIRQAAKEMESTRNGGKSEVVGKEESDEPLKKETNVIEKQESAKSREIVNKIALKRNMMGRQTSHRVFRAVENKFGKKNLSTPQNTRKFPEFPIMPVFEQMTLVDFYNWSFGREASPMASQLILQLLRLLIREELAYLGVNNHVRSDRSGKNLSNLRCRS